MYLGEEAARAEEKPLPWEQREGSNIERGLKERVNEGQSEGVKAKEGWARQGQE